MFKPFHPSTIQLKGCPTPPLTVIVKVCATGSIADTVQVVAGSGSALYPVMTTTLLEVIPGAERVRVEVEKPDEATATPGERTFVPASCVPSCLNREFASNEAKSVAPKPDERCDETDIL
jgi:hypothetical protein